MSNETERREVAAGRLPERYGLPWTKPFFDRVMPRLAAGARVLDVGSGGRPAISPALRPVGVRYVGLDVSLHELQRAPVGSYDDIIVGDVTSRLPEIDGQFDLVLSWQVLEHVPSMQAALQTQRDALVSGGHMIAMLSGGWGIHALGSRAIPPRVGNAILERVIKLVPEEHFPTHYDGCTDRHLRCLLASGGWSSWTVLPLYKAGMYLRFYRPLQRAYLVYENWAARKPRVNLATHYVVDAVK